MVNLEISKPRIHCQGCNDYDLCTPCYQNDRVSKSHQRLHKVLRIRKTHLLTVTDLIPASEEVNPEYCQEGTNWTIEGDVRWLHLREFDSHARFLAMGLEPGNYAVTLTIELRLSPKLTTQVIQQLKGNPMCKLRMYVGFPEDRKKFNNEKYGENQGLAKALFSEKSGRQVELRPNDAGIIRVSFVGALPLNVQNQNGNQVAILLQWEGMRFSSKSDDAIAQIALLEVRCVL
jgi:hypothetical protein